MSTDQSIEGLTAERVELRPMTLSGSRGRAAAAAAAWGHPVCPVPPVPLPLVPACLALRACSLFRGRRSPAGCSRNRRRGCFLLLVATDACVLWCGSRCAWSQTMRGRSTALTQYIPMTPSKPLDCCERLGTALGSPAGRPAGVSRLADSPQFSQSPTASFAPRSRAKTFGRRAGHKCKPRATRVGGRPTYESSAAVGPAGPTGARV